MQRLYALAETGQHTDATPGVAQVQRLYILAEAGQYTDATPEVMEKLENVLAGRASVSPSCIKLGI